jgi:hypothetical protein|tara:strand:+ start:317 stop:457 length:141 start_codon:yes stop_codon:yes gene_type:complete
VAEPKVLLSNVVSVVVDSVDVVPVFGLSEHALRLSKIIQRVKVFFI